MSETEKVFKKYYKRSKQKHIYTIDAISCTKQIVIFGNFFINIRYGFFGIRMGRYYFKVKNITKCSLLFSERNGHKRSFRMGKYYFGLTKDRVRPRLEPLSIGYKPTDRHE